MKPRYGNYGQQAVEQKRCLVATHSGTTRDEKYNTSVLTRTYEALLSEGSRKRANFISALGFILAVPSLYVRYTSPRLGEVYENGFLWTCISGTRA